MRGPIDLLEREKSSCSNIRVKLNEQSQACLSYAITSDYLTLVNVASSTLLVIEVKHGSQNIVSREFSCT